MNARKSAAIAELERCRGKSTEAHEAACELLEKADRHRERAARHAAAIAASADNPDPDDGDDDSDSELAYDAARRKRLIEIASRASAASRDASLRARAISIARLVHSA
jgi:hypothetical protein